MRVRKSLVAAILFLASGLAACLRGSDATQIAHETLARYRDALQARDLARLAATWVLTDRDRREAEALFSNNDVLAVQIRDIRVSSSADGSIEVGFEQILTTEHGEGFPSPLRARLLRDEAHWYLVDLRPDAAPAAEAERVASPPVPREPEAQEGVGTRPPTERPASSVSGPSAHGPAAAPPPLPADLEQTAASVLREYRVAYERRDLARLERIWRMNEFERAMMEELFERHPTLVVSIEGVGLRMSGSALSIDFDQAVERGAETRVQVPLRAGMMRRGSGEWVIIRMFPRDTRIPSAARPSSNELPPVGAAGGETQAILEALEFYEDALESRDLAAVESVWVLNPFERASLSKLLESDKPQQRISIQATAISVRGPYAEVDFEQIFEPVIANSDPLRALSVEALSATVERSPDGRWVITQIARRS
jgi:hypothetical protein